MLDTIDQTQWATLGWHVSGNNERIPVEIRNLLSQDADVRQVARGFLLGEGQHRGDVYDTTPHIIPFLITLLADDATPDKILLLTDLSIIAEQAFIVRHPSAVMIRLYVATYDAFRHGLPILTQLLEHESSEIRSGTANLIQYLVDNADHLIPSLLQRFYSEHDEKVQIALLNSLKTLFGSLDTRQDYLYKNHIRFFQNIIANYPSRIVRVAAARVAVEFVAKYSGYFTKIFSDVPALLAKEFLERSSPLNQLEQDYPDVHAEHVVKDLARLYPTPLLDLIRYPDLTPQQAHLVARGLLVNAFLGGRRFHWDHSSNWGKRDIGMFYGQDHVDNTFLRQDQILQAIVEADKVWQVPTNMFSYFYGLPDSREELRTLLDS